MIYASSGQWAHVLGNAEQLLAAPSFIAVKNGPRIVAGFVNSPGPEMAFIKRFDAGSWLTGLWQRVRGSRAGRSLEGASLLQSGGFAVPRPLAASEYRYLGSIRTSYLLSESLTDARTFSSFIDRRLGGQRLRPYWRRATLGTVAQVLKRLHDARLCLSDLQETNLMLEQVGTRVRVYFVDLDRVRCFRRLSDSRRYRNLVQLDRSVGRFLSRSERLRFLYTYLGGKPDRAAARRLLSRLMAERGRKEQEYARRRARRRPRNSTGAMPLKA